MKPSRIVSAFELAKRLVSGQLAFTLYSDIGGSKKTSECGAAGACILLKFMDADVEEFVLTVSAFP
jgi:hypothetical protein